MQAGLSPSTSSSLSNGNEHANRLMTSGPFTGMELPHETAKANAIHLVRNLITTYLVTHPHLDHLSGFVINTAGFQHTSRPKRLAGLPPTIDAFKSHIFNDVIWPNLSDEDGGVGLVSYMRLAEGGNLAIGHGEGRGYIEVCDGLTVKSWSVSHGKCMHRSSKRNSDTVGEPFSRRTSQSTTTPLHSHVSPRDNNSPPSAYAADSSAFFLRDDATGHEILIFGDVEPDSLSLSPRTRQVWQDAAPKIAAGTLRGIFIECSYDDSQSDEMLFGHLSPRHVIAELQNLAEEVSLSHVDCQGDADPEPGSHKRKRHTLPNAPLEETHSSQKSAARLTRPRRTMSGSSFDRASPKRELPTTTLPRPSLKGLRVIIIHVKDNLSDGTSAGDIILSQLEQHKQTAGLECEFVISQSGGSVWL